MFPNPADGSCADRAPGTVGAARRRRDRRLRAFLKHERLTVAMNLATVQHHSYMKSAVVDFCVQVGSPLAPVTEFVAPAPAVTYAAPAPVTEYVAPAPAVALSVPSQQLRPATVATGVNLDVTGSVHPQFSSTSVEGSASQVVGSLPLGEVSFATGVNLDVTGTVYPHFSSTAVDGSASQVVGSLPLGDVFAAPVFHQVHQEQLAGDDVISRVAHSLPVAEFTEPMYNPVHQEQFSAGDTTENFADFPVVQELVLVQAIPRVVGSLPPVLEFTGPVAQVHQEQLSASEMTENIADFPVVHEQVIVGMRPERLVDALGPQGGLERAAPPCTVVPSLSLPSLGDDAGHDVTSTQFLLRCALAQRERERVQEAEIELFSQSARLHRAVEGKWELEGDGDAKLFHNSVTGLSRFLFAFGHNHNSLCSNIVDDAPYCELKIRGQSSCYWLEPYGSRHLSNVRFQGHLREVPCSVQRGEAAEHRRSWLTSWPVSG